MSGGGPRRGRRDNGLDAAEYAIAGDVDPRVGEHLLDVLAAGGIAAYLQPSADLNPVTRTTTVPARPVDRLYVDRSHLTTARDYLTQLADEGGGDPPRADEPDIEAEWAKIVAGFHTAPSAGSHPWPAAEDVDDPPAPGTAAGGRAEEPAGPTATDVRRLPYAADVSGVSLSRDRHDEPSLLDGLDTFGANLPDEASDEEHYTPPPPPPLPRFSKYAVLGVACIVLGFLLFLSPTVVSLVDPSVVTLLGFTGILAGFVMLIWRLRPGDRDDHDPDDGAVV
ncbi:DUF308 domain-containing protein [Micromonospora aurantiaca]|uniref:DUF308 domain-containing protein n=1 Tax=Micromonospora aurantiaca (nom. illeg.) TaxID=47850 RepID=A0A6N3KAB8_9ACTN|nr:MULTISPECIES: DUF308 domain-containing protein [Micromonospora]ADL48052.1 hypothetical protein Micau_4540 [Micromonospora aurantiaca ATCC 27029]ADU09274.1 hypothetical protein ML5_3763 [Micromonospora sp. L5]AXH94106.1 DUF308 domain-containing protein [Micromonospora aurantiaca]KAB1115892.1 DUF308 domain-containing protein [Micromonospora aurantiaca]MDG4753332.1 DUF308 domain-containing protein [Micromonospora sp. WMMD718]